MLRLHVNTILPFGIMIGLILASALFAGCTGSTPAAQTPVVTTAPKAATTTMLQASTSAAVVVNSTPAPLSTSSEGTVIAFTAASLKGVSSKLAADFETMYPGRHVVFNLDGTQVLKTQIQNGAYADIFISASNSYTTELTKGGYFENGTVKTLTSNYVIVILPAKNPGNLTSLADLAKGGIKIARADKSVPVGTATSAVLSKLANFTYGQDWNASVYKNTVTYETSEPGVATKVALGEVDAGFVYESTYTGASNNTYLSLAIPKEANYLQIYTIGILNQSTSKETAGEFETFMLSAAGQQDLKEYGFRPA